MGPTGRGGAATDVVMKGQEDVRGRGRGAADDHISCSVHQGILHTHLTLDKMTSCSCYNDCRNCASVSHTHHLPERETVW